MSHKVTVIFCGNSFCSHNGRGQCDIGTASTKEDVMSFEHYVPDFGTEENHLKCLSFEPLKGSFTPRTEETKIGPAVFKKSKRKMSSRECLADSLGK